MCRLYIKCKLKYYLRNKLIYNKYKLIIDGATDQDDDTEVFDTFDCPECKEVTELCKETKKALVVYYQENVLRKIEEKQEEVREEEEEIKKSQKRVINEEVSFRNLSV